MRARHARYGSGLPWNEGSRTYPSKSQGPPHECNVEVEERESSNVEPNEQHVRQRVCSCQSDDSVGVQTNRGTMSRLDICVRVISFTTGTAELSVQWLWWGTNRWNSKVTTNLSATQVGHKQREGQCYTGLMCVRGICCDWRCGIYCNWQLWYLL